MGISNKGYTIGGVKNGPLSGGSKTQVADHCFTNTGTT